MALQRLYCARFVPPSLLCPICTYFTQLNDVQNHLLELCRSRALFSRSGRERDDDDDDDDDEDDDDDDDEDDDGCHATRAAQPQCRPILLKK